MNRYGRQDRRLAIALAATARYVDTIGFLKAGGFFVSFMSGNSTRLAVGIVRGTPSVGIAAGLIGAFVLGVMLGTTWTGPNGERARSNLMFVSALLAMAALADQIGLGGVSIFVAAAAMGAENATFARNGDVQIGLTYMTGTLVKFAPRLAAALRGERRTDWLLFLLLWTGLVGGGVLGAAAYQRFGFTGLWPAAAMLFALSLYNPGYERVNLF